MSGLPFSQPTAPGSGDQFNAADHRGHLLLIFPKSYQPEVQTKNGPSSAADVDIIVVDKPGPDGRPTAFMGSRLFGNLANSVRNDVGGQVLGRLDQISTQGGRTPWVLQNYTDQDAAMAGPALTAYQQGQFRQPANAQTQTAATAPPSHDPWAGMQTTPTPPAAAPQANWNAPAGTAAPTPPPATAAASYTPPPAAPAPPAAAPAVDPNLVAFLQSRGVQVTPQMDQATCEAIARSLPQ